MYRIQFWDTMTTSEELGTKQHMRNLQKRDGRERQEEKVLAEIWQRSGRDLAEI